MPRKKRVPGRTIQYETPNWEPLLYLARVYVDEFMWMCEIELKGGTRLHAYKHIDTRRYLHLTEDGRAFAYCPPANEKDVLDDDKPSLYEEVDPRRFVDLVMPCRLDPISICPPRWKVFDE